MRRIPFTSNCYAIALCYSVAVNATAHTPAVYYQSAPNWLENQIVIGELKKDEDLVFSAVERWLAIAPTDPQALFAKGRWLIRNNQTELAYPLLEQVSKSGDKDIQQAFRNYIDVNEQRKTEYNQIMLLQKGGQYDKALEGFVALFGDQRPDVNYELEYLDLLSTFPDRADEALEGYKALDDAFPQVGEIRIRLARHLARYYDSEKAIEIYSSLANDSQLGVFASSLWLTELESQPLSKQWFATYERVASYHPDDLALQQRYETAKSRWLHEKELRKDPLYRKKRKALQEVGRGKFTWSGYDTLVASNRKWPNDPLTLSSLAKHEYRRGNYTASLEYIRRARQSDDNPDLSNYYNAEERTILYWQAIDIARSAIVRQNFTKAEAELDKALSIDKRIALGYVMKGQVLRSQSNIQSAHQWAIKAKDIEPLSTSALELWVETRYPDQGNEGQLQALSELNAEQRHVLKSFTARVEHSVLLDRLRQEKAAPSELVSSSIFQHVMNSNADLPWFKKEIADELVLLNQYESADYMMRTAYIEFQDPEHTHAYSLFLVSNNRWAEAYGIVTENQLNGLTSSEQATFTRIKLEYHRQMIQRLSDDKNASHVLLEIDRYIQSVAKTDEPIATVLWSEFGYPEKANDLIADIDINDLQDYELLLYSQVVYQMNNPDIHRLVYQETKERKINAKIVMDREKALKADQSLVEHDVNQAIDAYVELIGDEFPLGADRYLNTVEHSPENAEKLLEASANHVFQLDKEDFISAMLVAIRLRNQSYINFFNNHRSQFALTGFDYWRLQEEAVDANDEELVEQFATTGLLLDDQERSESPTTRSIKTAYREADDNWMTNDLIATLDELRNKNQSYVMFGTEFNSVPNGATFLTVPVELSLAIPDWNGHLKLRTDSVYLDSGTLTYYDENVTFERSRVGQAFSIGWEAERWRADIGTTPIGFRLNDWVGGVEGTTSLGDVSIRGSVSKRPVTSSLISYSGLEVADRRGNVTEFGGVTRTGSTVSLSWNDGRPYGFWGYGEYHQLTGVNVADNDRLSGMTGGYYNVINTNDNSLSIGSSMFYMGYDKNLSEVVIGHGNYYSPQSYFSLSVPVSYYRRVNYDWTYGARASVSLSNASFDAPYQLEGNPSTSSGVSSAVQLYTEYKISDHWTFVGYLSQQFSSDYQPSLFNLYFKYNFDSVWEKAKLQPDPLRLYSNYY